MASMEEQILSFVIEETGIKRGKLKLSSRLADDIGLDGDDAVEFFAKFGEKFQVDLTVLYQHWHRHFVPESGGPRPAASRLSSRGCFLVPQFTRWREASRCGCL